jgi:hypothetical protein
LAVQTKQEHTLGLQVFQTLVANVIGEQTESDESDSDPSAIQKSSVTQTAWADWDDDEEETGNKEDKYSRNKSQKEVAMADHEEQQEVENDDAIDLKAIHDIFIRDQHNKLQELRNSHFPSLNLKTSLKNHSVSDSFKDSPQVSLIKKTLLQLKQNDQEAFKRLSTSIQLKGSPSKWTQLLSEL